MYKTRHKLTLIFFLSLLITLTSCAQPSSNQVEIKVAETELALISTKNKRYVLESGAHKIENDSKVIKFNKTDSLSIAEFDILDLHAKSLFCKVKIKYFVTSKEIENIAELLEWKQSIESYKELMIVQELKGEIREITGVFTAFDLLNKDFSDNTQVEKQIKEKLNKYINLESLELLIYQKQ